MVVSGPSPCIVGQNITGTCDIVHLERPFIRILTRNGSYEKMSLIDHERHSYIPFCIVDVKKNSNHRISNLAGFSASEPDNRAVDLDWKAVKKCIDRFHHHTYGHATIIDVKTLLTLHRL